MYLQVNIWEKTHMDKIIPSLLYNMQDTAGLPAEPESPKDEGHPSVVAETVLRDLVCRATFGNIQSVLKPVLVHLDNHNLWTSNEFTRRCFKIIMFAVQAQYGYVVVQMLMNHLDEHSKAEPKVKAAIVEVLAETVVIAAGGSIGPSVLEVFNTLLKHLRVSVDIKTRSPERLAEEKSFQEAVVNTIGEFANNLPDYQKIEILMFVMGKVPLPETDSEDRDAGTEEVQLQLMLMKTLLKVATKYKTVLISNAFPQAFLEPLIRMSLVHDPSIRILVQEILHTLIDRHENTHKLNPVRIPKDIAQLDLTVEKPHRQDIMFMKKNGNLLYWHIYENIQKNNNRVDNFQGLYCTMALLCLELSDEEVLVELFCLALGIQELAINTALPITHKCAVHALVAAYLNLMSQLTAIPALIQHVTAVVKVRRRDAPCYLPEVAFNRANKASSYPKNDSMKPEWMFDTTKISAALGSSGHDTSRLDTPYVPKPGNLDLVDLSKSTSDVGSISINLETPSSTPIMARRSLLEEDEEITFESFKKILENSPEAKEAEERKRRAILESFRSAPFEEIVANSGANNEHLQNKLNKILDMISDDEDGGRPDEVQDESPTISEMKFPSLFVY